MTRTVPETRAARPLAAAACLWLAASGTGADTPAPEALTDEHVEAAIDAIVEELYRRKDPKHFWDPPAWDDRRHGSPTQQGGHTALTVLALLSAGESYQDPRLRDAVEHLEKAPLSGTYAVSFRTQVWAMLPAAKFQERLEADAAWLIQAFEPSRRGWYYEHPSRNRWWESNSLRLVGTLGLWEAAKRGVPVDERLWRAIEAAFLDSQRADGGWNYHNNQMPPSGSMTAAGVTALMITQDFLHAREHVPLGRRPTRADQAIDMGLAWLEQRFDPNENRGEDNSEYYYYYLYLVERVGLASGRKTFGHHDWFREATAAVIGRLCTWDEKERTMRIRSLRQDGPAKAVWNRQLSLTLLFLSRGRVPVAFNKLRASGMEWNNRPRDVANLTAWIDGHSETRLSWQIVDLEEPPEQWLDAPVLYIASHEALPWIKGNMARIRAWQRERGAHDRTGDGTGPGTGNGAGSGASTLAGTGRGAPPPPVIPELDRLKRYLDAGGFILAVGEGGGGAFAESIETAGTLMYPGAQWRALPREHWAFGLQIPVTSDAPRLRGLTNGVRDLIVVTQGADLAASFQDRTREPGGHYHAAANLYFCASELGRLRPRLGRSTMFEPTAESTTEPTRPVRFVRAIPQGASCPEPMALDTFARAAGAGLQVSVAEHPLRDIAALDPKPHVVVVSGVEEHEFTEAERIAVRDCALAGGMLLFETAGGRGGFTASAERMAESLFGLPVIPAATSRVITGRDLSGAPRLDQVEYRPYTLTLLDVRETAPRLRGMRVEGQMRLFFSREDMAQALLDQPCWGVAGYSSRSARALLTNLGLHALAGPEATIEEPLPAP